jgi:DNA-binding MarR family transcriptional regulator
MNLQGETYKFILSKREEKRMETLPLEVTRTAGELRALLGRLSRRLRQTSVVGEMTLSQASVLSLLEREGPATPGILATKERISPQSMGTILVSLEALGLVSRTPDPTDGRRLVISLTEAGLQAVQGARRQREERLAQALADHFTAEEQQVLIAALPLLERLARVL